MNNYMMIKILLPLSSYKDLLKMHHPSLNDNTYALFFHVFNFFPKNYYSNGNLAQLQSCQLYSLTIFQLFHLFSLNINQKLKQLRSI